MTEEPRSRTKLEDLEPTTICVSTLNGDFSLPGYRLGALGMVQHPSGFWIIIHLPTGMTPGGFLAGFSADNGAAALGDALALRNNWDFMDQAKELKLLEPDLIAISKRHHGLPLGGILRSKFVAAGKALADKNGFKATEN